MNIVRINPCCDARWRQLIEQHPSSVFHSPEWLSVLASTYEWEPQALLLVDAAEQPRAGLPFFRVADIIGERIVALPFSDYCDPLVSDATEWDCLVAELATYGRAITIRPLHNVLPLADQRWTLAKQAKWHGLDLRPDLDSLWRGLHDSSRRAIRKAERDGVAIRPATHQHELRAFFDLHLAMRKHKYELLAQPFRFFEAIWDQFIAQNKGALMLAVHQQAVIGGIMFLEWNGTLYYKFNASQPAQLTHRPNDLLTWAGIKYAKEHGCTFLDFGLSDWDQEGLLRYKRKFATQEQTISFLRYANNREISQHEQQVRRLLGDLTTLLTDAAIPDHLTDKAGNILYRYFT